MTVRDDTWIISILHLVADGRVRSSDIIDDPSHRVTIKRTLGAMQRLNWLNRRSEQSVARFPTAKAGKHLAIDSRFIDRSEPVDTDYEITPRDRAWDAILQLLAERGELKINQIDIDVSYQTKLRTLRTMEEMDLVARQELRSGDWFVGPLGVEYLSVDAKDVTRVWGEKQEV